eukprot:GHVR01187269.1.p2 GENE.GHVR01187269.1~~GHVR01187269.1.p2  ORF type:complete len:125 (-),score=0.50 GHVR01187269.1:69-443(-)
MKPANVLLDTWFEAKLTDFGAGGEEIDGEGHKTSEIGTIGYVPPEVFKKKREGKGPSRLKFYMEEYQLKPCDIFGFGVTMFEMANLGEHIVEWDMGSQFFLSSYQKAIAKLDPSTLELPNVPES